MTAPNLSRALEFDIEDFGLRVWGLRSTVKYYGLWCMVDALWPMLYDLWFRVWLLGLRKSTREVLGSRVQVSGV